MGYVCNTSIWEAEVEDLLSLGVQDCLSNKMKQSCV